MRPQRPLSGVSSLMCFYFILFVFPDIVPLEVAASDAAAQALNPCFGVVFIRCLVFFDVLQVAVETKTVTTGSRGGWTTC